MGRLRKRDCRRNPKGLIISGFRFASGEEGRRDLLAGLLPRMVILRQGSCWPNPSARDTDPRDPDTALACSV